jgi:2,5-diketo-D-gluconate reductase B
MSTDTIIKRSITIPKVGIGTYQLTGSDGQKSIENALQIGYRHIDTAQFYRNEEEVGNAIWNSGIGRENVFLTTKIWPSDFHRLIEAVENSLRKLKTGYLDLLLLHWPSDDEANKKAVDNLNKTLSKGYSKSIGVSNFNISQLDAAIARAPVICNQVEYHPFLSQQKMLTHIKEQDMFLTAYSPLALGKVAKNTLLMEIARRYKKTASQVTLRWLIQQGDVAVIPKASSAERRKQNLDIFDFELSKEDMAAIFTLSK